MQEQYGTNSKRTDPHSRQQAHKVGQRYRAQEAPKEKCPNQSFQQPNDQTL
jgi:hypothetical protein